LVSKSDCVQSSATCLLPVQARTRGAFSITIQLIQERSNCSETKSVGDQHKITQNGPRQNIRHDIVVILWVVDPAHSAHSCCDINVGPRDFQLKSIIPSSILPVNLA